MANASTNTPCAMAPRGTTVPTSNAGVDTYGVASVAMQTVHQHRLPENQPKKRGPKPGSKRTNQSVVSGQSKAPTRSWQYNHSHSVSSIANNNNNSNSNLNVNKQLYPNDPYAFQCDSFSLAGSNYHEQQTTTNTKQATTTSLPTTITRHNNPNQEHGRLKDTSVTQTIIGPQPRQAAAAAAASYRRATTPSANSSKATAARATVLLDDDGDDDHGNNLNRCDRTNAKINYNNLNLVNCREHQIDDCNDRTTTTNDLNTRKSSNQYIATDNEQQNHNQQQHTFNANLIKKTNISGGSSSSSSSGSFGQFQGQQSASNTISLQEQEREQSLSASCNATIMIAHHKPSHPQMQIQAQRNHHQLPPHHHHAATAATTTAGAASQTPQSVVSPQPPPPPQSQQQPPQPQMVHQGHAQQQQQVNSEQNSCYNATANDPQQQQYLAHDSQQAYPPPPHHLHNNHHPQHQHHHPHHQQQHDQQQQQDQTTIMPNRFDDSINGGIGPNNRLQQQQQQQYLAPANQASNLNKVHQQASPNTHHHQQQQQHHKHHHNIHQAQATPQHHQRVPVSSSSSSSLPYQQAQHTQTNTNSNVAPSYAPPMQAQQQQQQAMPLHNSSFPLAGEAPSMQVPRINHLPGAGSGNGGGIAGGRHLVSQQQQQPPQQQQHRGVMPPYVNQQQQHIPVRPNVTTNTIVNHAQHEQQHHHQQPPNRIIGPPRTVVTGAQQQQNQQPIYRQQQGPHISPNQHNKQPISASSHVIGGDLPVDQYVSSSPTLLQQQLNRQRAVGPQAASATVSALQGHQMPPQQRQVQQAQTGMQRHHQSANQLMAVGPQQSGRQIEQAANAMGNRHIVHGEQTVSDIQHNHHHHHGGPVQHQAAGPLAVDRYEPTTSMKMVQNNMPQGPQHRNSGPYYHQNQQQQQNPLLAGAKPVAAGSAAAANLHKQPRQSQQPQHMRQQVMQQQQQPLVPQQQQQQQPMDNHHLLCNPTPPLTPNAAPPHLIGPPRQAPPRLGAQLLSAPEEWQQQQSHHQQQQLHHHHNQNGPLSDQLQHFHAHPHQQQQQQPPPSQASGFNGPHPLAAAGGGGGQAPVVHMNQKLSSNINHYHQHPSQQQSLSSIPGNLQVAPMNSQQQRMDPTTAATTVAAPPPPTTTTATIMPKSNTIQYHSTPQQATSSHAPPPPLNNNFTASNATAAAAAATGMSSGVSGNPMIDQTLQAGSMKQQQPDSLHQTRLTLPLQRDKPLLGPFKLDHGVQYTNKVFHIKPQLFDTLSKSMSRMAGPQTAAVIQELQFRAYLIGPNHSDNKSATTTGGDSLLANNHNHHHHHHHHQHHQSPPLASTDTCNWPELFQISINQQVVHLDRSTFSSMPIVAGNGNGNGNKTLAHKAADIFQYCNLGDNILDIQVNDCYCSHEFVLELVDRPTLKAFMNSCFKTRLLPAEVCLQKLRNNFGAPGFLIQQAGIFNDYVSEITQQPNGQQLEQTRARVSLKCLITGRRMRTPAHGPDCKHAQCFDLESFLVQNRDRTRWKCPICLQPIAFNLIELDQFQMNIIQSMSSVQDTDDVLIDPSGQWQPYYASPPQPHAPPHHHHHQQQPSTIHYQSQNIAPPPGGQATMHRHQQQPLAGSMIMQHTTAKANGTFHPQESMTPSSCGSPAGPGVGAHPVGLQQSPARPMSGGGCMSQQQALLAAGSPASNWDHQQHAGIHSQQPAELRASPAGAGGVRRPPSAMSQTSSTGRRSATGGATLAKRAANHSNSRYSSPQPALMGGNQSPQMAPSQQPAVQQHRQSPLIGSTSAPAAAASASSYFSANGDTDELSPLAAMERTIIQHEQQMGPPLFDPNSLTASPLKATANNPNNGNGPAPIGQLQSSTGNNFASPQHQQSPEVVATNSNQRVNSAAAAAAGSGGFSPIPAQAVPSPAATGRSTVPVSPQQQQQNNGSNNNNKLPQSPMQQQQQHHQTPIHMSISTPATPLIHCGPETPASPTGSSMQQHCGPGSVSSASQQNHSPHVASSAGGVGSVGGGGHVVDHQPLSNGSASVASITSTSTLTPSGQSLGSVGMGGDSRCNTAPLQNVLGSLDDLVILQAGSSGSGNLVSNPNSMAYSKRQMMPGGSSNNGDDDDDDDDDGVHHGNSDILMSKLMLDQSDSLLRDRGHHELALALEEAEWKQQLDRGKSEHLANFLNEPLMNKRHHHHHHHHHHHNQQHNDHHHNHHHYNNNSNNNSSSSQANDADGANRMLSGGLNPSDDEGNPSPQASSPGQNGLDQLDHYTNYLDSGSADDGAGLPPDDSILDLFER